MTFTTLGLGVRADGLDNAALSLKAIASAADEAEKAADRFGKRPIIPPTAPPIVEKFGETVKLSAQKTQVLAYQLNDLSMMLATGQSPFMALLQQGSQVVQLFDSGTGVRGAMKAVGASIVSFVTSPLNLALFGVAAVAGAIPLVWSAITDGGRSAEQVLKDHDELIDKLLLGYDAAADKVDAYIEAAKRLPEATATRMLGSERDQLQAQLEKQLDALTKTSQVNWVPFNDAWNAARENINAASADLAAGRINVEQFVDRMSAINLDPDVPIIVRAVAGRLLTGAQNARELEARIMGVSDAISTMDVAARQSALLTGTFSALGENSASLADQLRGMAPDTRNNRQRAIDFYNANSGSDASGELKKMLDYTLSQIDKQEGMAAGKKAAQESERLNESYARLVESANQRVASAQLEAQALGMTEEAANRLRIEQDLLNRAAQAGIELSPTQRSELTGLAGAMATAEEHVRRMTELYEIGRDTFTGFFRDFTGGLRQGATLWDAFAQAGINALDRLASKAAESSADGEFTTLFGGAA